MIKSYFQNSTGFELSKGLKILVQVYVQYSELYSISLNIIDIEPTYTIGDVEKRKQEILQQLLFDGVFNLNKDISFPSVPQKIAVISSKSAAGYQDFQNQLENNLLNLKFDCELFHAQMQGEKTENSVISALDSIFVREEDFDLVVIIRGGGAKSDLLSFDNYNIAYNIAQFPIPIITGIGHERDDTVADQVAHLKLKTPTAVADFLISKLTDIYYKMENYESVYKELLFSILQIEKQKIEKYDSFYKININNKIANNKEKLLNLEWRYKNSIKYLIKENNDRINNLKKSISLSIMHFINNEKQKLKFFSYKANNNNPQNIMKKGFSITRRNGKIIKDSKKINVGDEIETLLYKDSFKSVVL